MKHELELCTENVHFSAEAFSTSEATQFKLITSVSVQNYRKLQLA